MHKILVRFPLVAITLFASISVAAAPKQVSFTNDPEVNSFDLKNVKSKRATVGTAYTIDTRDQKTRHDIQKSLKINEDLCAQDSERPYATVVIFREQNGEIEYGKKIADFSNTQVNNGRNVLLMDMAVFFAFTQIYCGFGLLFFSPPQWFVGVGVLRIFCYLFHFYVGVRS